MAVECPQFVFAAPPKAGCVQMMGFMKQIGETVQDENAHAPRHTEGKPTISIFRDPANWLRSYHVNINTKTFVEPLDQLVPLSRGTKEASETTFQSFAENVLNDTPTNFIYRIFAAYRPDKWYPTENLKTQLESFVGRRLQHVPRNESRRTIQLDPKLRQEIYDHEPLMTAMGNYQ